MEPARYEQNFGECKLGDGASEPSSPEERQSPEPKVWPGAIKRL